MIHCVTFSVAGTGVFAANGLNNNAYPSVSGSRLWKYGSTSYSTLSAWQVATGQDSNAVYTSANAGLDSTYRPPTGSVVIDAGANLTSLGISALNSDKAGVDSPASGPWVEGGYAVLRTL